MIGPAKPGAPVVDTCRTGDDELAVVDGDLCARKIRGLFVADASSLPVVVRGNIHAPAVMLAEHLSRWLRGASAEAGR